MADYVEYRNGSGDVSIVLDGQNSRINVQSDDTGPRGFILDGLNGSLRGAGNLQLDDPSDGSELRFLRGTIVLRAENDGTISVTNETTGASVVLSTSAGVIIRRSETQETVRLSPEEQFANYDQGGRKRFEYAAGNLGMRAAAGLTTFEVDGETGDIRHLGDLTKIT